MAEVTQEFMYELLKKLNQRFDKVDHSISELRIDNATLRNQLHVLQGDVNNLRASMGHIEHRIDRIENRLELRELQETQARFESHP
jgi:predicted nuclease with TOPRIM domain